MDLVRFSQIFAMLCLVGCQTSGSNSVAWPVETFPHGCEHIETFVSGPPLCTTQLFPEKGFSYREEFDACRQSVQLYVAYIDRMKECMVNKTRTNIEDIATGFSALVACKATGSDHCSSEKVRQFYKDVPESVIGLWFPQSCDRTGEFSNQLCTKDLRNDAKTISEMHLSNAEQLLETMDEYSEEAIRSFNCIANREKYCL
ncbi:MAG: hypothetical protein CMO07_08675 [Thalassospira sp.]|uniref:hypothetical protein n=1 Tax=Thalassospira sp. UBA4513 TaxID=1947675 RepID=UPI000C568E7B|nr:hypothetical protein [Thalassospira sp. UBA4513]MBE70792.1 hypothetical protein [Thalassospira sp.]HAI29581.1 hypothetical protein [Thalassospira sp.]